MKSRTTSDVRKEMKETLAQMMRRSARQRRKEEKLLKAGKVVTRYVKLTDGTTEFDEIVAHNASVHLEKMDSSKFCLLVYSQSETVCFFIGAKRADVDCWETWREREVKPRRLKRPKKSR